MKMNMCYIAMSVLALCLTSITSADSITNREKYLKTDIILDIQNKTGSLLIVSNGDARKDHSFIKQTTAENYINPIFCPNGGCYILRSGDIKTFMMNIPEDDEGHVGYFTIDSEYNKEKEDFNFSSMLYFSQSKELADGMHSYTSLTETNRTYSGEENDFLVLTGRYDHAPGDSNLEQHFKVEIVSKN